MGILDDTDTFEEREYVRPRQSLERCQGGGIASDKDESVRGQVDCLPQELQQIYIGDLTRTMVESDTQTPVARHKHTSEPGRRVCRLSGPHR